MTKPFFSLTNFFPLHPFVSLHPHTSSPWLPQTCVIRDTACAPPLPFLSTAQVFEVSRSSDHLTYFIKNTWDAIRTACSSSSRRSDGSPRSSDTSHPSSSPMGRSYHVSLIYARSHSHIYLLEWLMRLLHYFTQKHMLRANHLVNGEHWKNRLGYWLESKERWWAAKEKSNQKVVAPRLCLSWKIFAISD